MSTIFAGTIAIGTTLPSSSYKLHLEEGSAFIGDVAFAESGWTNSNGYKLIFDNSHNTTIGTGVVANKIVLYQTPTDIQGIGHESQTLTFHSTQDHCFYCGDTPSTYGTKRLTINNAGIIVNGAINASSYSNLPSSTTSLAGIVQLNDTYTSISTSLAPTANALKQVADIANSKVSSQWTTIGDSVVYNNGRIGVGGYGFSTLNVPNANFHVRRDNATYTSAIIDNFGFVTNASSTILVRAIGGGVTRYIGMSAISDYYTIADNLGPNVGRIETDFQNGLMISANFNASTNNIRLCTGFAYTERLRITNSGNVGIGNTNPQFKLDVGGTINSSGDVTIGGNLATSGIITTGGILLNGISWPDGNNIDTINLTNTYIKFGSNGSGNDWAYLRQIGGTDAINIALDFYDNVNDAGFVIRDISVLSGTDIITERFKVQRGGNVGIGTDPAFKLDVNGSMRVNGSILTTNGLTLLDSSGNITDGRSIMQVQRKYSTTIAVPIPDQKFRVSWDNVYTSGIGFVVFDIDISYQTVHWNAGYYMSTFRVLMAINSTSNVINLAKMYEYGDSALSPTISGSRVNDTSCDLIITPNIANPAHNSLGYAINVKMINNACVNDIGFIKIASI